MRGVFRPLAVTATSAAKRADRITVEELEQLTYGFADRYLTYIITAPRSLRGNARSAIEPALRRKPLADKSLVPCPPEIPDKLGNVSRSKMASSKKVSKGFGRWNSAKP